MQILVSSISQKSIYISSMNKLDITTRKLIIRCLVEGQSIRATARTADVSKNTVTKLMIDAGTMPLTRPLRGAS